MNYTLCWGFPPVDAVDYALELGAWRMNGPACGNPECILSLSCTLSLAGVELSSENGLLLIESGHCGVGQFVFATSRYFMGHHGAASFHILDQE